MTVIAASHVSPALAEDTEENGKQDKTYVGLNLQDVEFRTSHGKGNTKIKAAEFVLGSYITDYVRVEGRAGTGITDAEAQPGLDAGLDYWFSWYMGAQYPITDYAAVYAQYGFSYVQGSATRDDPDSYPDITDEFLSSNFSVSYALGMDFSVAKDWLLNLEFGRLHKDSETKYRTLHLGLGLKYEF